MKNSSYNSGRSKKLQKILCLKNKCPVSDLSPRSFTNQVFGEKQEKRKFCYSATTGFEPPMGIYIYIYMDKYLCTSITTAQSVKCLYALQPEETNDGFLVLMVNTALAEV